MSVIDSQVALLLNTDERTTKPIVIFAMPKLRVVVNSNTAKFEILREDAMGQPTWVPYGATEGAQSMLTELARVAIANDARRSGVAEGR